MIDYSHVHGWWSVRLVTAIVLVIAALAVRFYWDQIREAFRGQLGWGVLKSLNRYHKNRRRS